MLRFDIEWILIVNINLCLYDLLLLTLIVFQVKSVFGAKMFALGVVIKIPVPKQTAKTNFQVTSGRAKYNAAIDCLVWKRVIFCLITIGVFLEDVVKDSGTFLVLFVY